jgi:hypothetical protein
MLPSGARIRVALLVAVIGSACNGQFDFDTTMDAEPPIIVIEAGPDDAASTSEQFVDAPRTGVHIACGASDCLSSGCCSTSPDSSCIDIAEGGTCGGVLIQCDDTDDCPEGQVCCAEGDDLTHPCTGDACGDQRLLRVHCEPEARCRGEFIMLCNPDRPNPCTQCIAASIAGLPPGYHQCAATP